ncbi:MAG: YbhN family protein [Acidobacteria bacterium]|nr:YbhN family protein [Acidobacteriota bacterium]
MDDPTPEEADAAERAEALAEIGDEPVPLVLPRNDWRRIGLRLLVSAAFLALLFWRLPDVSLGDLLPVLTSAAVGWLVVAVVVHLAAYGLQTLRWAQVSDALGIHLPFRRLASHLLAGEFVSNALPTSFGGDVLRVLRQGDDVGDHADSFASTSLERLTGWLVLPMLSAIGLLAGTGLTSLGTATLVAVVVDVVTLVALGTILWVAGHPRGAGRLVDRAGWQRYLGAVHLGIVAVRHHPGRVARIIGAGLAFQFLQCVSVWACARALGLPQVTLFAAMAFFPPSAVVQNFPLTLGGLGVREAAFVLFFGALGVADEQAIALGLLVYLVFVVASLAGAPAFVLGRRRRRASSRDGVNTDHTG